MMTTPQKLLVEIQSLWTLQPPPPIENPDSEPPPTPESERLFREACRYFDDATAEMARHNPPGLASIFAESVEMATPCFRCGGRKSYLAIIHDGESLRRDCSQCGRFVEFATWHDRTATGQAIANVKRQA